MIKNRDKDLGGNLSGLSQNDVEELTEHYRMAKVGGGFYHNDVIEAYREMKGVENAVLSPHRCSAVLKRFDKIADYSVGVTWDTLKQAIRYTEHIEREAIK